jgi:glutamine amidotransferase
MRMLAERGLTDTIRNEVARGKSLLGICLGMQLLFERGYEFGDTSGLGLIDGYVDKLGDKGTSGCVKNPSLRGASATKRRKRLSIGVGLSGLIRSARNDKLAIKIPHMGWDSVEIVNPTPVSATVNNGDMVYFVHSYKAVTPCENISLLTHYGQDVPALVFRGNVYGAQFHPEKSGEVGLKILRSFAEL